MANAARSIDFMSLLPPLPLCPFPLEIKQVLNFFEDDQFSGLLSRKKDRVSIQSKDYQQKRFNSLILKEIYQQFKITNTIKAQKSFFKFCTLRPK